MLSAPILDFSTSATPDDVLVVRARARDEAAFGELVRRHEQELRYVVSRLIDSQADQEDVRQNALLSAWRFLPAFEGRSKFGSWIHRVTANSALMLLRGSRKKREALVGDVEEWERSAPDVRCGHASCWIQRPDEAMESAELRALLQRLLGDLSPRLREVFVLRYVDGLSVKDTARVLGTTESATKTRLHRACDALRAAIHRDADDLAVCRKRRAPGLNERKKAG